MNRKFWIALALGLLVCIGIGYWWTARLDIPSPKPWWYGKDAVVRVEVWEPGKDMASVAMTMPKKALDYMHAFSLKSRVALGHDHYFDMNEIWGRIQRLPKGRSSTFTTSKAISTSGSRKRARPRTAHGGRRSTRRGLRTFRALRPKHI
jgi:hypothetical protein